MKDEKITKSHSKKKKMKASSKKRSLRRKKTKKEQIDQIVLGLSIFNQESGVIYAASATLAIIFCSFPFLLYVSRLVIKFERDQKNSFEYIFQLIRGVFPSLNNWSEEHMSHLIGTKDVSIFNNSSILLFCLGFIGLLVTLQIGIRRFAEVKTTSNLKDYIKLFFTGASLLSYICMLIPLSINPGYIATNFLHITVENPIFYFIDQYPLILPTILSLIFFSITFYVLTPYRIRLSDALMGATIFTGFFYVLKTGSWLYLHYFGKGFNHLFGVFSPIMMSVVWTFFIMNCIFISSCISIAPGHRRARIHEDQQKKVKTQKNLKPVS